MTARQLRLFPPAQPLLEQLGAAFFRSLPRAPGVYLMRDQQGLILYIGQSKNLRARLAAYKNARPESMPRKVIRLIHQVRSVSWELCATPAEALLLETRLLQQHRPRFNMAKTWPPTSFFCGLQKLHLQLRFRLTAHPLPDLEQT